MKTLINKVALVTSATRGIGFASALKLAQEGAIVYLGVRRMEDTQEICDRYTQLKMIPVYFDAYKEETYKSMIDTIIEANENSEQLYFICLDEMNLGCVEHYFSDFLSALYSKNKEINLYSNEIYRSEMKIISEKLGVDKSKDEIINNIGIDEYARLERRYRNLEKYKPFINIPSNVRFIGTINRDATTKDLSPKVIDRSIIININSSFDTFEELIKLKENSESIEPIYISSDEIVSRSGDMNRAYIEFKKLIDIFNKNGLELNFRFLQTAASMLEVEGIERSSIIDYIIATKVLPKINLEVNEDNKFINELETILYNNKISEGIYKDIKDFYNENEIMTYWR